MATVTYQTRVPDSLLPFCERMGILMSEVERCLYQELKSGTKVAKAKRYFQVRFGINARQFNAVHAVLKGKVKSRQECHKRQINELKSRISDAKKRIKKLLKQLKNAPDACSIRRKGSTIKQNIRFQLHQKKRRLTSLETKLAKLKDSQPTIIFGGRKLWQAQFNLEANGYDSHEAWLKEWQEYRASNFYFIGSKDETAGCQVCQLDTDGNLKIRVPKALESDFGKYVTAQSIQFNYGQDDVLAALQRDQALSYRFARKDGKWYIFVTTQRPEVPFQTDRANGMIGVDLNPGVVGWAYADAEGNLKHHGQFNVDLQDKTSNQTEAILGDVCQQIATLAKTFGCPVTVESLDFSRKKAGMREQGVRYSRMLSNFAYSKFDQMLLSRCDREGIELLHRNPAYSSTIGMVKFMSMYGLSSDTAAAFAMARRGLRKSERIPSRSARELQVDYSRHVWSHWAALKKGLSVRRHNLFTSRVAYSEALVNLLVETASVVGIGGKHLCTSASG